MRTIEANEPLSTFVGRDEDLEALGHLFEQARLVTVSGPGGVGKTRLALRWAATSAPAAIFVDLATSDRDEQVAAALSASLGLEAAGARDPLQAALGALADADTLILVDNCEHLLDAAAHLIEAVLHACPDVRLLATSREALALPGEAVWRLAPLPPSDARRLFLDRAYLARPGFQAGDVVAVDELCARLDHLPLAIELAAGRVASLSLPEMSERLAGRLRVLGRGARTAPRRQQTLEATVAWSYDLLDPPERRFFPRLGVFRGGFSAVAAAAICAPGEGEEVALQMLANLVEKSLVVADVSPLTTRYRLLASIADYAWRRLEDEGEVAEVCERHAGWFAGLAVRLREEMYVGRRWREGYETLGPELDNLRAALQWTVERDDERVLELAAAIAEHCWQRGSYGEAKSTCELALARCSSETPMRAICELSSAWACSAVLDRDGMQRHAGEGLRLARRIAPECLTWALATNAMACLDARDLTAAIAFCREARALGRSEEEASAHRLALGFEGMALLLAGDAEGSIEMFEQSLELARAMSMLTGIGYSLIGMAEARLRLGQPAASRKLCREATAAAGLLLPGLYGEVGLAHFEIDDGGLAAARRRLDTVAGEVRRRGIHMLLPDVVWLAARLAAAEGDAPLALRLLGAEAALAGGAPRDYFSAPERSLWVAHARARVGRREAARFAAEGERLSAADVMALLSRTREPAGPLSRRESEVAELVAEGLTNRDIARRLYVSERTVEGHVEHALSKLGFRSRAQLAAWVAGQKQVPAAT